MNEEEKKAIEYFKESFNKTLPPFWYDDTIANNEEKIKILLNLTYKLQEALEQEKEKNKKLEEVIDMMAEKLRDLKDDIDNLYEGDIDCFIPKDFCDIDGCAKYKDCADCIKEYYFNKVKENKNE